jgi:hypothetical protein
MDFVPTDQDPVAIGEVFLRLGGDHTAHERSVGDEADCPIVVLPGALGKNSLKDIRPGRTKRVRSLRPDHRRRVEATGEDQQQWRGLVTSRITTFTTRT